MRELNGMELMDRLTERAVEFVETTPILNVYEHCDKYIVEFDGEKSTYETIEEVVSSVESLAEMCAD